MSNSVAIQINADVSNNPAVLAALADVARQIDPDAEYVEIYYSNMGSLIARIALKK